jgi:Tfp pilus assembly protein FimV
MIPRLQGALSDGEEEEENEERLPVEEDDQILYPPEDNTEDTDLDDEAYPTEHDIRARLFLDLDQLSKDASYTKLDATLKSWYDSNAQSSSGCCPYLINLLRST